MSGKYNGAQSHILKNYEMCIFSPCACHSLNLVGQDSASVCPEAVTFFGMVQTVYGLFSTSPKRWEILHKHIGVFLHGLSGTRWTERISSVRPFAAHLPGIKAALSDLLSLNLTAKARTLVNGTIAYLSSFKCVIMAAIWVKILSAIDIRNQVIQARNCTIDVEVSNLESLLEEMKNIRNEFPKIMSEARHVAEAMKISTEFTTVRQTRRESNELPETEFQRHVYFLIVDSVIAGLTSRFKAVHAINDRFCFLWKYRELTEEEILASTTTFSKLYAKDVSEIKLKEELIDLKRIHSSNIGHEKLAPISLLNKLSMLNLLGIFPNVSVALRIFCTLPATVASAERSFSKLKMIKNYLRSTMSQSRLNDLAILSIESDLAREVDFSECISTFAAKTARKVPL